MYHDPSAELTLRFEVRHPVSPWLSMHHHTCTTKEQIVERICELIDGYSGSLGTTPTRVESQKSEPRR